MDFGNFSSMAGKAFNAYEQNQNQGGQGGQGGQNQGGQGGQYQGGQGSQQDQDNQQNVPDDIQQGLSHVQNNADNGQYDNASHDDLDHNQLNQANRQAQGNGPVSSQAIGQGAAVQALKSFVGGGGSGSGGGGLGSLMSMAGSFAGGSGGGGGGNLASNPLVMMAMTQAKSMFEQQHAQGNVQGGGSFDSMKQEAINSAGHAAMQMVMGSGGSGGGGFNPSQLMGLASKFM